MASFMMSSTASRKTREGSERHGALLAQGRARVQGLVLGRPSMKLVTFEVGGKQDSSRRHPLVGDAIVDLERGLRLVRARSAGAATKPTRATSPSATATASSASSSMRGTRAPPPTTIVRRFGGERQLPAPTSFDGRPFARHFAERHAPRADPTPPVDARRLCLPPARRGWRGEEPPRARDDPRVRPIPPSSTSRTTQAVIGPGNDLQACSGSTWTGSTSRNARRGPSSSRQATAQRHAAASVPTS